MNQGPNSRYWRGLNDTRRSNAKEAFGRYAESISFLRVDQLSQAIEAELRTGDDAEAREQGKRRDPGE